MGWIGLKPPSKYELMPPTLVNHDAPFIQFRNWYKRAERKGPLRRLLTTLYPPAVIHQPEAMSLATSTPDGKPSVRIVLFKGFHDDGFVFYTNYNSRKGQELIANPRAAIAFHWAFPERQIRIEGKIEKLSYDKSSAYWDSRPRGSRLSGLASPQSSPISDRRDLLKKMSELDEQFEGKRIPCPEFWGGFVLLPQVIEFWEARLNRCHERLRYTKIDKGWSTEILAP